MKTKNEDDIRHIFQIFSYFVLIVCLLGTIQYVRLKGYNTLMDDEASEMILGNLLASENKLVTEKWFYSTELEVFSTNIFLSFFFHFSNNWHRVRILATVSMYLMEIIVLYFMSKTFHFRRLFPLVAAVLFIPFSADYYQFMLNGAYYYPFVTTTFFTLLTAELYLDSSRGKKKILLVFTFIFSLLISLGGMRQCFYTYFPMLITSLIIWIINYRKKNDSDRRLVSFSVITFAGSIGGIAVNSNVLSSIYHFTSWDNLVFSEFDFNKLGTIFNNILIEFGYTLGDVFSASALSNAVCALWLFLIVAAIWYAIKNHSKISGHYFRLALFTLSSFIIDIVFHAFTNMGHEPRHIVSNVCLSFILVTVFFEQIEWKKIISAAVFSMIILLTAASGLWFYISNRNIDNNQEIKQAADFLVSEGYLNGYSTFFHGNILTEFSDGQIEIWILSGGYTGDGLINIRDIDTVYPWLQKVSHETTHPGGKVFLILTPIEYENNNWKNNLKDEKKIWESSKYLIYGYESYEDLINNLYSEYIFQFEDGRWLNNGKDVDGYRYLNPGGYSFGPYMPFWAGTYEVCIEGNNLTYLSVSCTSNNGLESIPLYPDFCDDKVHNYHFELQEKTINVETIAKNVSEDPEIIVQIEGITISKKK